MSTFFAFCVKVVAEDLQTIIPSTVRGIWVFVEVIYFIHILHVEQHIFKAAGLLHIFVGSAAGEIRFKFGCDYAEILCTF